MDVGKARAIALFKYGIIAPACGGFLSECSKEAYYREAAKKKYTMPDGKEKTFAASTIKKWAVMYQTRGIEALMSKSRSDAGVSRTITEETGKLIMAYREKFPKITGQKISLRYPPEDRSFIYIYDEKTGKRLGEARPVNKSDNRLRKRRKNVSYASTGEGGDGHV